MDRGTSKRHGRIRHPEMFSLTLDLAGPVQPGLDAKGLRYLLAAKFTLSKEFVKAYPGRDPPSGDGMEVTLETKCLRDEAEEEGERKELIKPSLQPPQEGGDQKEDKFDECSFREEREELKKPSLQPPQEGGDPFISVEDEPGEQGPLFDDEDEPGEQGPDQDDIKFNAGTTSFIGAKKEQREAFGDGEESVYAPTEPGEPSDDGGLEVQEEGADKGPAAMGDCEPPEAVALLFARALKDNSAISVKRALQDIVLYSESHGLPVYRLHADHGETFNHDVSVPIIIRVMIKIPPRPNISRFA